MLTEKAIEILNQMASNMRKIEKHYQPVNGMDSDEHKTIRVMAQAIAFLLELIEQTDDQIKENEAAMREASEKLDEMFPFLFKKNDKAS